MLTLRDYLTAEEAAEYACVPLETFEAHAHEHGIVPFAFLGHLVYRKADLQMAMERAWQLLANTGLRRGEAQNLNWKDVGKEEIRVLSREDARTKSGKWRIVPVSEGAQEALGGLQGGRRVLPEVAPTSLSRAFERTLHRAEIPGSLHCLRHTYCSHLAMAGVPLRTVQVLAGHSSYKTTERYAHLAPGHLREAVAGLRI